MPFVPIGSVTWGYLWNSKSLGLCAREYVLLFKRYDDSSRALNTSANATSPSFRRACLDPVRRKEEHDPYAERANKHRNKEKADKYRDRKRRVLKLQDPRSKIDRC